MPDEPLKIVVVEDDASMSQAIERLLRAGGFAAVLFASAEAALEAAGAAADCLVLDIHLPGMSGFDLYRRLTLSGQAVPAVFITARDEPAVRDEAERLGGAGSYLPKPFSGRDLLDAVTRALRCH
jgi:FixJ family two-component response regulator